MKPAVQSFLLGLVSLFDVAGALSAVPVSRLSPEADLEAMRSDWEMVWQDLRVAFAQATDGQGQAKASVR